MIDFGDAVYRGIEKELERIIRGEESLWFDPKKAGISVQRFQHLCRRSVDQWSRIARVGRRGGAHVKGD